MNEVPILHRISNDNKKIIDPLKEINSTLLDIAVDLGILSKSILSRKYYSRKAKPVIVPKTKSFKEGIVSSLSRKKNIYGLNANIDYTKLFSVLEEKSFSTKNNSLKEIKVIPKINSLKEKKNLEKPVLKEKKNLEKPVLKEKKTSKEKKVIPKNNSFMSALLNIKDDFVLKIKEYIDNFKTGIEDFKKFSKDGLQELRNSFIRGFLGPFNLILEPLQKLLGVDFYKKIDSLIKKIVFIPLNVTKFFGKKLLQFFAIPFNLFSKNKVVESKEKPSIKKTLFKNDKNKKVVSKKDYVEKGKFVKPKRADILKSNPEIIYLSEESSKKSIKNKKDKPVKFSNFGKVASLIPVMLAKAGAVTAIAGGLVWAFVDGLKGIKFSKEWGASKVSSFVGSFLGTTEEGFKGAFSNMGKWALVGVGTGFLVAGPVGAIAGGLIGAAVGGILGFIGGKNIAKGIDTIGSEVSKVAFSKENIFEKMLDISSILVGSLWTGLKNMFGTIPEMIVLGITKNKKKASEAKELTKNILDFGLGVFRFLGMFTPVGIIMNNFKAIQESIHILSAKDLKNNDKFKKIMTAFIMSPFEGLLNSNIFRKASAGLSGIGSKISEIMSDLLSSSLTNLKSLGSKAIDLKDTVSSFIKGLFSFVYSGVSNFFEKNDIGKFVKKYVVEPIQNFFTAISDFFGFITSQNIFQTIKDFGSGKFGEKLSSYTQKKDVDRTIATPEYKDYAEKQNKNRDFVRSDDTKKVSMYKASESVHDAIITPLGRIIRPDKDDTIIATKSPVSKNIKAFDSDNIQTALAEMNKKFDNSINVESILAKMDTLISTIKTKEFNNIMTSVGDNSIDFDELRRVS